jgi:hypothetical protein
LSKRRKIRSSTVEQLLRDGALALLLDGLDDIPTASLRSAFLGELAAFQEEYGLVPIVLTSRTEAHEPRDHSFRLAYLEPIDPAATLKKLVARYRLDGLRDLMKDDAAFAATLSNLFMFNTAAIAFRGVKASALHGADASSDWRSVIVGSFVRNRIATKGLPSHFQNDDGVIDRLSRIAHLFKRLKMKSFIGAVPAYHLRSDRQGAVVEISTAILAGVVAGALNFLLVNAVLGRAAGAVIGILTALIVTVTSLPRFLGEAVLTENLTETRMFSWKAFRQIRARDLALAAGLSVLSVPVSFFVRRAALSAYTGGRAPAFSRCARLVS